MILAGDTYSIPTKEVRHKCRYLLAKALISRNYCSFSSTKGPAVCDAEGFMSCGLLMLEDVLAFVGRT